MKPPKSWLEEYSNSNSKQKNGNNKQAEGSFGTNMDNSFRHYMGRKIELQRNQFGLVLPPTPESSQDENLENTVRVNDSSENKLISNGEANMENTSNSTSCGMSMSNVLSRLGKKHRKSASKHKQLLKRRKRARNESQEESSTIDSTFESPVTNSTPTRSQSPPKSNSQRKKRRKDLFFSGITVLVNGYTDPSSDTIQRIMHKHGGDLEKYETDQVTHIIAQNLSDAKAKIYKNQKRPIPVVHPDWIVDCVKERRLLPHADYLLHQVRNENVGASVKSFFKPRTSEGKCTSRNKENVGNKFETPTCLEKESKHTSASGKVSQVRWTDTSLNHSPRSIESPCKRRGDGFTLFQNERETPDSFHSPASNRFDNDDVYDSPQSPLNGILTQFSNVKSPGSSEKVLSQSPTTHKILSFEQRGEDSDCGNEMKDHDKSVVTSPTEAKVNNRVPGGSPYSSPAKKKIDNKFQSNSPNASPTKSHGNDSRRLPDGTIRTTGTDPNFLDAYFASSRLSFIGSFKQRLTKSRQKSHTAARGLNAKRFVFHIDMDCFFAAVAIRKYPQYRDCPVAVGHAWRSDPNGICAGEPDPTHAFKESFKSRAELSTCNYKAREYGVKKGMFLDSARELCPDLVVLPYDYEGYESTSNTVGEILVSCGEKYQGAIEQVSCDESYIEIYLNHENGNADAEMIGENIRKEILESTKCSASIGIGNNKLLAKLATNTVKNKGGNGVHVASEWKSFLRNIRLKDIPGVGYRINEKLQSLGLTHVHDVWDISPGQLASIIGEGNAAKIYGYCHGQDDREVKTPERKTIGAECNWGVRFNGLYGPDYMIQGLAKEVEKRMTNTGYLGTHLVLKVKLRKEGAGRPGKHLGHGKCNDHSKSCYLPGRYPTRDAGIISKSAIELFNEFGFDQNEIRGMGIVIDKLKSEEDEEDGIAGWLNKNTNCKTNQPKVHEKMSSEVEPIDIMDETSIIELDNENEDEEESPVLIETPCQDTNTSLQSSSHVSKYKPAKSAPRLKKTANRAKPTRVMNSDGQFDVRSMFKLASIKSGEDHLSLGGEQVSLTQLDSLPLEIQLQVANNDHVTQNLISRKSSPRRGKARTRMIHKESESLKKGPVSTISTTHDQVLVLPPENEDWLVKEDEEYNVDDLIVLANWMTENHNPSAEDVQHLIDFLFICVDERRLDDVVVFLRAVRIRTDNWRSKYENIRTRVENHIYEKQGRVLDIEGLCL
ncbi:hypothetical protein CTEN210_03025 [Chaetoceros tenuissimus]|uniref:DNA repair protein REV1 n=1 Tax=Chaetoceros tenuissimus TaxID=426638 RepID=A0AAD3CKH8_9STRA|nr:hypothetical protein CTEN210_03025 [Chaetoceros tenuissimus]